MGKEDSADTDEYGRGIDVAWQRFVDGLITFAEYCTYVLLLRWIFFRETGDLDSRRVENE